MSFRGGAVQSELDAFFANLGASACLVRGVCDRALAKARAKIHVPALHALNQWLVQRAQAAALVQRWQGLRVVCGDASVLYPARRACHRTRSLAPAQQHLFGLFLPGAELMLGAWVHGAHTDERQMLFEALDALGPDDVLVLDRGYPATWLVQLLNERGIRFCIRCDVRSGWQAQKDFLRSGADEAWVQLPCTTAQDVQTWQLQARLHPGVRLVRQVSSAGRIRVLATNLPQADFAPCCFGDLYHQRWRIEEAFKRLKHRLGLESVSGLSQHALLVDVACKVLADNLASLLALAALEGKGAVPCESASAQPGCSKKVNRAYAARCVQRVLGSLLDAVAAPARLAALVADVLACLAAALQRHVLGRSQPRPDHHLKPHPSQAYKGRA